MAVVSLAAAFGWNRFVQADHGRIVFFACLMIFVAIFSAWRVKSYPFMPALLAAYATVHVALCFVPWLADDSYFGIVLLPVALVDYTAFIYAIYFLLGRSSAGQALIE